MHGLYRMSEIGLRAAYDRAMAAKAYAVAERIAFQLNEPGVVYVPPVREVVTA